MSKHIFTNRSKLPKKKPSKSHLRTPKKKRKKIVKKPNVAPKAEGLPSLNMTSNFDFNTGTASTVANDDMNVDFTSFKTESKPRQLHKYTKGELDNLTKKLLWPIADKEGAEYKKKDKKDALVKSILKANRSNVKLVS